MLLVRERVSPCGPNWYQRLWTEPPRGDPLFGFRYFEVTNQHTRKDFAQVVKKFVDRRFAQTEKIVWVVDNLNTHGPASLYKAFSPAEAKRLTDKLGIHYTSKHGSWLDMAEIELLVLARQFLSERMSSKANLQKRVTVWQERRNAKHHHD